MDCKTCESERLGHVLIQRSFGRSDIPYPDLAVHAALSVRTFTSLCENGDLCSMANDSPASDELALTAALQVDALDPRVVLSPHTHHDVASVVHPLVEETDHAVAKAGDKDISDGLVRRDGRQVGSCLSGNILRVFSARALVQKSKRVAYP